MYTGDDGYIIKRKKFNVPRRPRYRNLCKYGMHQDQPEILELILTAPEIMFRCIVSLTKGVTGAGTTICGL